MCACGCNIDVECDGKTASVCCNRPSWEAVLAGYPKNELHFDGEIIYYDKDATDVSEKIFNNTILNNACATRVSIALLSAKMDIIIRNEMKFITYPVQKGDFTNAKVIIRAEDLQKFLSHKDIWCDADVRIPINDIPLPNNIDSEYAKKIWLKTIREKIKETGYKNGVYIIVGKIGNVTGHATLWVDNKEGGNTILFDNSHDSESLGKERTVYFWGLK